MLNKVITQLIENHRVFDIEVFPNLLYIGARTKVNNKNTIFGCGIYNDKCFKYIDDKIIFEEMAEQYLIKVYILLLYRKGIAGYNSVGYDDRVLQYFIDNYENDIKNFDIYSFSKLLIESEDSFEFLNNNIDKQTLKSVDLFRILHYNNKHRATSLKWLEFFFRMESIEELPYKPNHYVLEDELSEVIDYCNNDLEATSKVLDYVIENDLLSVRKEVSKLINKDVTNYSNVRIGSEINKHSYIKLTNNSNIPNPIKRPFIELKHCIPDYIKFRNNRLEKIRTDLINKKVTKTKGAFSYNIRIDDLHLELKQGGLHSKDLPCIYEETNEYIIYDIDVGSMYPNRIIESKYYPQHLGLEWLKGYENTKNTRIDYKKQGKKALAEAYKLSLNGGGFGKTNDEFDWQFDPLVTMQTTINCQLDLLMLIEDYLDNNFKIISVNTDGITLYFKKSRIDEFRDIYKQWEKVTKLEMEETIYKKYVRRDVNNYIALKNDNKLKYKGIFDYNREPHKNHSMMIVPIALEKYFFNNISIEKTIRNHSNIFDFCKAVKAKGDSKLELWKYEKGEVIVENLQKVCRYYVSNTNDRLMKLLPPLEPKVINVSQMSIFDYISDVEEETPRIENIEKNFNVQLFNQSFLSSDYNINYDYYINECYKVINVIEGK